MFPNRIDIRGNTYFRNFGGKAQGILDIRGLNQAELVNETFIRNGENTVEAIQAISEGRFRHLFLNSTQGAQVYSLSFFALISDFS